MPRKRKTRIFWRERGGERRAYGDFRDLGGGQEALIAKGDTRATTDSDIAAHLVALRVSELEGRKRSAVLLNIPAPDTLASFASKHLVEKKASGKVTDGWLEQTQKMLERAVAFFGADRDLASIAVRDVQAYASALHRGSNGRGEKRSGGSVRHYLNVLSNLYRRAQSDGAVPPGYNPVASMVDKPTAAKKEARWMEAHDAALFLEAARHYRAERDEIAMPYAYPLVATFLLTGGREAEVLGLEVEDVSFDRRAITFRPHAHRRLKTDTSHRTVPLWPQLEEILRAYIFGGDSPRASGLLFPAIRTGAMVTDVRKILDGVAVQAGWKRGEIRSKMFRHTYCAARLQTLDRGAPVSVFTVGRELGHGGDSLVKRVYGHLGDVRHRSDVVEFRVEQHADRLGGRIAHARTARPKVRCKGTTTSGERCKVRVNLSRDGFCLWHDAKRTREARQARPHARP
jgi:integrase